MAAYRMSYIRPEDLVACRLERKRLFASWRDLLTWAGEELKAGLEIRCIERLGLQPRILMPAALGLTRDGIQEVLDVIEDWK